MGAGPLNHRTGWGYYKVAISYGVIIMLKILASLVSMAALVALMYVMILSVTVPLNQDLDILDQVTSMQAKYNR